MTSKGEKIVIDAISECFGTVDCTHRNKPFGEFGMDSMSLLTLHHKITEKTDIGIPPDGTLTTISKLGAYIDQQTKQQKS